MSRYIRKGYRNQQKICTRCGEKCLGNGRTKYCNDCKEIVKVKKFNEYQKRKRDARKS